MSLHLEGEARLLLPEAEAAATLSAFPSSRNPLVHQARDLQSSPAGRHWPESPSFRLVQPSARLRPWQGGAPEGLPLEELVRPAVGTGVGRCVGRGMTGVRACSLRLLLLFLLVVAACAKEMEGESVGSSG